MNTVPIQSEDRTLSSQSCLSITHHQQYKKYNKKKVNTLQTDSWAYKLFSGSLTVVLKKPFHKDLYAWKCKVKLVWQNFQRYKAK